MKKLTSVSFPKNERKSALEGVRLQNGNRDHHEAGYLGPYLLKQVKVAAIYCGLGLHTEAICILEQSIEIPVMDLGQNHAPAKFSGCMQLGDTYAMLGQIENSIVCYTAGLEIQQLVLGDSDP
ncbi:KINESIN LIGHT CHAIN-RELATED 2-like [Olea europaea subsp. europaea]|uniref:KINESIN LIGHT CHAIN-RELATED 2-like n=1 Tax=Olea europaea subsp. europaea TaxID=158383 RepID=A0A8S0STA7_OLEEU|nr:KINESIN LIGHT CHAIN-RELATED 2-like [Olea europaea subsp. europaea]